MRLLFEGQPGPHVGPKDLILHAIGAFGAKAGTGYAVEFAGTAVRRGQKPGGSSGETNA